MAASSALLFALFLCVPYAVLADTCLAPDVKSQTYTTSEAISSTETVFILEFTLTCKNKVNNLNLYADINGKVLPVTRSVTGNKYQVSLTDEHKNLPSGSYDVRLYDEEGFAALRKAIRSGESTENIKPVYTLNINHSGVWKGAYVQSEFVAAAAAIIVWYFAYSARSKLQSGSSSS